MHAQLHVLECLSIAIMYPIRNNPPRAPELGEILKISNAELKRHTTKDDEEKMFREVDEILIKSLCNGATFLSRAGGNLLPRALFLVL